MMGPGQQVVLLLDMCAWLRSPVGYAAHAALQAALEAHQGQRSTESMVHQGGRVESLGFARRLDTLLSSDTVVRQVQEARCRLQVAYQPLSARVRAAAAVSHLQA